MGVLHQLQRLLGGSHGASAEASPRSSGVESMALLFQTILQEDRLSPLLRVWIARLQTPVMQQALANPDSFEDQAHPARRLLAHFGSCAMGFAGSVLPCGALEQEIKRLVLLIEQYPDVGTQIYEQANEEFEKFLASFQTGLQAPQKVDCVVCQKDQKEALSVQYTIALRDLLKDQPASAEIREFLFKVWTQVLAVTAVRQGLQHADTLALKKTAVDLICANGALTGPDAHSYAIRKIPKLLQRLRAGMTLIALLADEQDAHIKLINGSLSKAFLSGNIDVVTDTEPTLGASFAQNDTTPCRSVPDVEELRGLEINEDDQVTAWRLWDCALVEQESKDQPLQAVELHHQRVAGVIRNLWDREECGGYINKLMVEGDDGMGHGRIGFKQSAAEALMTLARLHESKFGSLKAPAAAARA
jgi:hypothetical protein